MITYDILKLMKEAGCQSKEDCEEFLAGFGEQIGEQLHKQASIYGKLMQSPFVSGAFHQGDKALNRFSEGFGAELGKHFAAAVIGGFVEAFTKLTENSHLPERNKKFVENLIKEDSILRGRKPEVVLSHYETLHKLAPSISTDKNAVSSFLRQSTQYENIDVSMIRTLAELEEKILKGKSAR